MIVMVRGVVLLDVGSWEQDFVEVKLASNTV